MKTHQIFVKRKLCYLVVSNIFIFTLIWGRFPFWRIFFRWVVQPPTRVIDSTWQSRCSLFSYQLAMVIIPNVCCTSLDAVRAPAVGFTESQRNRKLIWIPGEKLKEIWSFLSIFLKVFSDVFFSLLVSILNLTDLFFALIFFLVAFDVFVCSWFCSENDWIRCWCEGLASTAKCADWSWRSSVDWKTGPFKKLPYFFRKHPAMRNGMQFLCILWFLILWLHTFFDRNSS